MAGFQKLLVSLLVFLGVTFVYFAQTAEAAKGPKITHKVRICGFKLRTRAEELALTLSTGLLRHQAGR